jgi:hypothetical protein
MRQPTAQRLTVNRQLHSDTSHFKAAELQELFHAE